MTVENVSSGLFLSAGGRWAKLPYPLPVEVVGQAPAARTDDRRPRARGTAGRPAVQRRARPGSPVLAGRDAEPWPYDRGSAGRCSTAGTRSAAGRDCGARLSDTRSPERPLGDRSPAGVSTCHRRRRRSAAHRFNSRPARCPPRRAGGPGHWASCWPQAAPGRCSGGPRRSRPPSPPPQDLTRRCADSFGPKVVAARAGSDDDRVRTAETALGGGCGSQALAALDGADWEMNEPAAWHLARFYDPNETDPVVRDAGSRHPDWAAAYYAHWAPRVPREAAALKQLCTTERDHARRERSAEAGLRPVSLRVLACVLGLLALVCPAAADEPGPSVTLPPVLVSAAALLRQALVDRARPRRPHAEDRLRFGAMQGPTATCCACSASPLQPCPRPPGRTSMPACAASPVVSNRAPTSRSSCSAISGQPRTD